jgi:hypothetical protein
MAAPIPTNEPQELVSGDRWQWTREFSDYPASVWTLTYSMHRLGSATAKITITASADGDGFDIDESMAATAAFTAGDYKWVAHVTDGTSRYLVDTGTLTVADDLEALTAQDERSHWQITLDNVEPIIQGRASKDQSSFSIGGRSLSRMPWEELERIYDRAKMEVNKAKNRERAANGLGQRTKIKSTFKRPA